MEVINKKTHNPLKIPSIQEPISREECLIILKSYGIEFSADALRVMRLPNSMTRGIHKELEFFDGLSLEPIKYNKDESPFEASKIPSWIHSRYLGIEKNDGITIVVFIDVQRKTFVKEEMQNFFNAVYSSYMNPI